jgi:uncharacterized protein YndB with AHSA1/START domain
MQPSLQLTKVVPASPEVVYDAWLSPQVLRRFMCPAPGCSVTRAEVDPKVGGKFLVLMHIGGQDRPHHGEYLVLERPRRMAFTWRSAAAGDGSHVELTFEPTPEGTKLTLVQFGLPSEDAIGRHIEGWTAILQALATIPDL